MAHRLIGIALVVLLLTAYETVPVSALSSGEIASGIGALKNLVAKRKKSKGKSIGAVYLALKRDGLSGSDAIIKDDFKGGFTIDWNKIRLCHADEEILEIILEKTKNNSQFPISRLRGSERGSGKYGDCELVAISDAWIVPDNGRRSKDDQFYEMDLIKLLKIGKKEVKRLVKPIRAVRKQFSSEIMSGQGDGFGLIRLVGEGSYGADQQTACHRSYDNDVFLKLLRRHKQTDLISMLNIGKVRRASDARNLFQMIKSHQCDFISANPADLLQIMEAFYRDKIVLGVVLTVWFEQADHDAVQVERLAEIKEAKRVAEERARKAKEERQHALAEKRRAEEEYRKEAAAKKERYRLAEIERQAEMRRVIAERQKSVREAAAIRENLTRASDAMQREKFKNGEEVKYPYVAYIDCRYDQRPTEPMYWLGCFGSLSITSDNDTKEWNVSEVARSTHAVNNRDSLRFDLTESFQLVVQGKGDSYVAIHVVIQDRRTGKTVFQDRKTGYGVVRAGN